MNWCKYEWFYSEIDYPFFQIYSEFNYLLKSIGCTFSTAPRSVWRVIRYFLGPPRPFSRNFTQAQRTFLEDCRRNARDVREGRASPSSFTPNQLLPGDAVLVIHPMLGELLTGCISQQVSVENRLVFFYNSEIPPVTISDCNVMPHASIRLSKASDDDVSEHPTSVYEFTFAHTERQENRAFDEKLLAAFQFLHRKREIVNTLCAMNDLAQSYISYSAGVQVKYSDFLIGSYTQLVLDLEETDKQLKTALAQLKGGGVAAPTLESSSSSSSSSSLSSLNHHSLIDAIVRGLDATDPTPPVPGPGYCVTVTVQPLEVHQEYARRLVAALVPQQSAESQVVTNAVALYSFLRHLVQYQAPCELTKLIEAAETVKNRMHTDNALYNELFTLVVSDIQRALTPRAQ